MSFPKSPLDLFPYLRDPRSQPITTDIDDGVYVYVQDVQGVIHVLPDGPHHHPKVLGNVEPALYAGDLRIEFGKIVDITNLSGTFQFDDPDGLVAVAEQLFDQGFAFAEDAIRFFPNDGSSPLILNMEP
jgi:hypothetical protein